MLRLRVGVDVLQTLVIGRRRPAVCSNIYLNMSITALCCIHLSQCRLKLPPKREKKREEERVELGQRISSMLDRTDHCKYGDRVSSWLESGAETPLTYWMSTRKAKEPKTRVVEHREVHKR